MKPNKKRSGGRSDRFVVAGTFEGATDLCVLSVGATSMEKAEATRKSAMLELLNLSNTGIYELVPISVSKRARKR